MVEPPPAGVPARQIPWRSIALYALAAVFLALVIWRSRAWEAGDEIDDISLVSLALVPALAIVPAVPLALRSREILGKLGYRISSLALIPSSYYGNSVGFLTPASSGELLRPSLLERSFGVPIARGAAVVLYERLFSMYVMCLTGLLAFTWTGAIPIAVSAGLLPVFALLPMVPTAVMRVFNLRMARVSERFPSFIRSRLGGLSEAGDAADTLWRSPGLVASFTALSVAVFGVMMLQFWLIVQGTGENLSLMEAWVVLFVSNMVGVASGLPLGLGATDAVMISLLGVYGVDVVPAGAIVILTRCLINLPAGLLGLLAYVVALRQRQQTPAADLRTTDGVPA
jgi:uncharacterized protein (TIRG00374 family)